MVSGRVIDNRKLTALKAFGVSLVFLALLVPLTSTMSAIPPAQVPPGTIDPTTIPKWVNTLTGPPPVYVASEYTDESGNIEHNYSVDVTEFYQQILPAPLPTTKVWGYGGEAKDSVTGAPLGYVRNSPAPSFEAQKGVPINVKWTNSLTGSHQFAVDPTLHWANPNGISVWPNPATGLYDTPYPPGYDGAQAPVPIITHLHGGEVSSLFDGQPEAWYTENGLQGMNYNTYSTTWDGVPIGANEAVFHYPNEQPATTLWYHDHALGITRINVMSGLAGFYLLRDAADPVAAVLPTGAYEMPLVFQDRTFNLDGSLWFPTVGLDQSVHPYWNPEFFGNTIMVNGKIWPSMSVDQGWYRFRLLDGSNARFYTMSFRVLGTSTLLPFYQIGTDGGYLTNAAPLNQLTIAPGERADILVDFSAVPAGSKVLLSNIAKAPFPTGAAPNPKTEGQLVQFVVSANPGFQKNVALIPQLPTPLNPTLTNAQGVPTFPSLAPATKTRTLVLWEVMGMLGPTEILLNGQKWMSPVTETPVYGTTEEWLIVNPTADTHPIHLHLTQFQLVSRQRMDTARYAADWVTLQQTAGGLGPGAMPPWPHMDGGYAPLELSPAAYLRGKAAPAPANEQGWKDTIQVNPGEVTILRIRFAPIDGSSDYPFDPTVGPGYVWHCHILDHEDNEMMRPYEVQTRPV